MSKKIKCYNCGKECEVTKCSCGAEDWQCECGCGSGHIHSNGIELTDEEWKEICKKADAYDNLKIKCERQAEHIERNQNKAKRCGEQQKLLQNAVCKLRQHNKDLLSIIRTKNRELANKGRDIGKKNNQIVQLQKQLKDQRHQICMEIKIAMTSIEPNCSIEDMNSNLYEFTGREIYAILEQIEKGE